MKINLSLNILLADDDEDDRLLFREAVSGLTSSIELNEVCNGAELMQLLENTTILPHAIFLDLNMPCKNGFECLLEIKQNESLKNLLVFIYSTSFQQDVADRLYRHGAYHFIRKPSNFVELKRILTQALSLISESNPPPVKENFVLL